MSGSLLYRRIAFASLLGAVAAADSSVGQQPESTRSVEFASDTLSFDFEAGTTAAANFRFRDGNVMISAAEGKRLAGGDDVAEEWSLTGDVVVTVDSAIARADSASARFSSGHLVSAELLGEPVSIETTGEDSFHGSANRIAYADAEGVFGATGNATFSRGSEEVRCDWIYNVRTRTARGFSSGDEGCRYVYVRRQDVP